MESIPRCIAIPGHRIDLEAPRHFISKPIWVKSMFTYSNYVYSIDLSVTNDIFYIKTKLFFKVIIILKKNYLRFKFSWILSFIQWYLEGALAFCGHDRYFSFGDTFCIYHFFYLSRFFGIASTTPPTHNTYDLHATYIPVYIYIYIWTYIIHLLLTIDCHILPVPCMIVN